jgi:hypothetical protein
MPRPQISDFGSEFFAPVPLVAVVIFAVNNWLLKARYPSWITGKLSDVTACFFLPLLISAFLDLATRRRLRRRTRLVLGAVSTIVIFSSVKLSQSASDAMTSAINTINGHIGIPRTHNQVDPTDLIALPFVAIAVMSGNRAGRR